MSQKSSQVEPRSLGLASLVAQVRLAFGAHLQVAGEIFKPGFGAAGGHDGDLAGSAPDARWMTRAGCFSTQSTTPPPMAGCLQLAAGQFL